MAVTKRALQVCALHVGKQLVLGEVRFLAELAVGVGSDSGLVAPRFCPVFEVVLQRASRVQLSLLRRLLSRIDAGKAKVELVLSLEVARQLVHPFETRLATLLFAGLAEDGGFAHVPLVNGVVIRVEAQGGIVELAVERLTLLEILVLAGQYNVFPSGFAEGALDGVAPLLLAGELGHVHDTLAAHLPAVRAPHDRVIFDGGHAHEARGCIRVRRGLRLKVRWRADVVSGPAAPTPAPPSPASEPPELPRGGFFVYVDRIRRRGAAARSTSAATKAARLATG
mmetsp:Transcript_8595/g.16641  ORF Transcript_8595/g.16641 Transcript_8595/m.16641 type:complete len:282 (-) Transcript_8595:183-1028(-)